MSKSLPPAAFFLSANNEPQKYNTTDICLAPIDNAEPKAIFDSAKAGQLSKSET
jgi:hypothetical protein